MGSNNRSVLPFTGTHPFTVAADDLHDGIGELVLNGDYDWLTFSVDNTDAEALDQFEVQAKAHSTDSEFVTYHAVWTANIVGELFTTADLKTLATTVVAIARINVTGLYSIQFVGSSAVAPSDTIISGYAVGYGAK